MKRIKRLVNRRKRREGGEYVTAGSDGFAWQEPVACDVECDHDYCNCVHAANAGMGAMVIPHGTGSFRCWFEVTEGGAASAVHVAAPVRAAFLFAAAGAAYRYAADRPA